MYISNNSFQLLTKTLLREKREKRETLLREKSTKQESEKLISISSDIMATINLQ